ncbi:MAG: DNA-3-methyladenine glycosylase [Oscillospiraceae bacterium]
MRLTLDYYKESAQIVAPMLVGKLLCRNIDGEIIKQRIIETECYVGEQDTACHAHKGRTQRTEVMYSEGGIAYVYLCYGIHNLLNVVSGAKDFPSAVLIRATESFSGPGKLTKAMQIDRRLNGENLVKSDKLWLEQDNFICEYTVSKRVGIDYATEEYREKLWRFTMKNVKID